MRLAAKKDSFESLSQSRQEARNISWCRRARRFNRPSSGSNAVQQLEQIARRVRFLRRDKAEIEAKLSEAGESAGCGHAGFERLDRGNWKTAATDRSENRRNLAQGQMELKIGGAD